MGRRRGHRLGIDRHETQVILRRLTAGEQFIIYCFYSLRVIGDGCLPHSFFFQMRKINVCYCLPRSHESKSSSCARFHRNSNVAGENTDPEHISSSAMRVCFFFSLLVERQIRSSEHRNGCVERE